MRYLESGASLRLFFTIFLLILCDISAAAQVLRLRILDQESHAGIPFATIRLGHSNEGFIADMDGFVLLPATIRGQPLHISALSYEPLNLTSITDSIVYLAPRQESLKEAVVRPNEDEARRILRRALAHRNEHNPEQYNWYQCHVYYKMVADVALADTGANSDTSKEVQSIRDFVAAQHMLVSETYSRRSYQRPQQVQEDIQATRFSGFKSPLFAFLVTDILPFHCYSNYLHLNGRDFRNPLSPGAGQWYHFGLHDRLLQGGDTLWMISFFPKRNGDVLRGFLYITSRGYAVTNLSGTWRDTALGTALRIEQHYTQVQGRWFPQELNYVVTIPLLKSNSGSPKGGYLVRMEGRSHIDSVTFQKPQKFKFDKTHPTRLLPNAGSMGDSAWQTFRAQPLDAKDLRTYVFMDSFMTATHADRYVPFMKNLLDAKIRMGPLDLNLDRLYRYNSYEGSRWGLGLQTNDQLSRRASIGAWAGYGNRDAAWKWGGFAEAYFDDFKETKLRFSYEHELHDPGRISLHPELNRAYLLNYFIQRADMVDAWSFLFEKRFGYLTASLEWLQENVSPQYPYQWHWEGNAGTDYSVAEARLRLRYAYAERRAPMLGKYYSTGTRYPVLYAELAAGETHIAGKALRYYRTGAAMSWQKHLTGIGKERWQIEAAKLWSDAPLPLGQLFAARGIHNGKYPVYLFGGIQTLAPYRFMMDGFISGSWRHDFDWRLYRMDFGSFGSMPGLSLQWNGIWGTISHAGAQQSFSFQAPTNGYYEAGLLIRDALRMRYLNLCYIGLTGGYFYPLQSSAAYTGAAVLGLTVSY